MRDFETKALVAKSNAVERKDDVFPHSFQLNSGNSESEDSVKTLL